MPRRLSIAILALALLAGCNRGGGSVNPIIIPSPTPDPTITTTTITATSNNNPLVAQPISEFTSVNGNPGTLIATQNTDATGKTTFTGLTPGTAYCWQYQLTSGNQTTTVRFCGTNWQFGIALAS